MKFMSQTPSLEAPNPEFAHSPSDALQCFVDLKTTVDLLHRVGGFVNDPIGDKLLASNADWHDWQSFLKSARPFYWSTQTANLVSAASESYPLVAEDAIDLRTVTQSTPPPSYLPKRLSGFCVFQSPCLWMTLNGSSRPLSALGWHVGIQAEKRELCLSVRGVMWRGGRAVPVWWSDGGSAGPMDSNVDETFSIERLTFTKWICTAAMFIEQEILTVSNDVPGRAFRKRCERAEIAPTCHVVSLRKEIYDDRENADVSNVEWSHRWIVRGHWRNQYFPTRNARAPIWIHPHVKGPADKPFSEELPVVYAVRR